MKLNDDNFQETKNQIFNLSLEMLLRVALNQKMRMGPKFVLVRLLFCKTNVCTRADRQYLLLCLWLAFVLGMLLIRLVSPPFLMILVCLANLQYLYHPLDPK